MDYLCFYDVLSREGLEGFEGLERLGGLERLKVFEGLEELQYKTKKTNKHNTNKNKETQIYCLTTLRNTIKQQRNTQENK